MRTRPLKALALAGVLAVTLTGCLKMDLDLELQSDDTIDGSMVFAVSEGLAEMMGTDAQTLADEMQGDMLTDAPEGATVEPYDDGEFVGSTMTFEGESLDAFAEDESLVITREGDEFVVAGYLDLSEGAEEMPGLTDSMEVSISITFPGEVTEHDGELEGSTVTWVPVAGERLDMNARGGAEAGALSALGGASRLLLLAGVGLAVLLVLGLVLFLVLRSRRSGQPAAAPATAYGAAPVAYPGGTEPATAYPAGGTWPPAEPGAPTTTHPEQPTGPTADRPTEPEAVTTPQPEQPTTPSADQPAEPVTRPTETGDAADGEPTSPPAAPATDEPTDEPGDEQRQS